MCELPRHARIPAVTQTNKQVHCFPSYRRCFWSTPPAPSRSSKAPHRTITTSFGAPRRCRRRGTQSYVRCLSSLLALGSNMSEIKQVSRKTADPCTPLRMHVCGSPTTNTATISDCRYARRCKYWCHYGPFFGRGPCRVHGLDQIRILFSRGGITHHIGNFQRNSTRRVLVCKLLVK